MSPCLTSPFTCHQPKPARSEHPVVKQNPSGHFSESSFARAGSRRARRVRVRVVLGRVVGARTRSPAAVCSAAAAPGRAPCGCWATPGGRGEVGWQGSHGATRDYPLRGKKGRWGCSFFCSVWFRGRWSCFGKRESLFLYMGRWSVFGVPLLVGAGKPKGSPIFT